MVPDGTSRGPCPGAKTYIETEGVREYHKEITAKDHKYNKPGLETSRWNAPCIEVTDPFGNKLLITEKGK